MVADQMSEKGGVSMKTIMEKDDNNLKDSVDVGDKHNSTAITIPKKDDDVDGTNEMPTTAVTKKKKIPSRKMKNKKRNRKDMDGTREERQLAIKMDRYQKLVHMANKQLIKQAKQVRAFMVQRNIRKLKKNNHNDNNNIKNNNNDDSNQDKKASPSLSHKVEDKKAIDENSQKANDDNTDKNNKNNNDGDSDSDNKIINSSTEKNEDKGLQALKDMPIDLVVQQAVRQLGLLHANPDPDAVFVPPPEMDTVQTKLVSSVLDHKRFQSALEDWNEKVAEFRRFCLHLDDRNNSRFADANDMSSSKRAKKKGKHTMTSTTSLRAPQSQQASSQEDQTISFFCSSLNAEGNDDVDEIAGDSRMMAYGPAATMGEIPLKKNRRGQRARKAKALALEAKREGRQYHSINWREEKKTNGEDDHKQSRNKRSKDNNSSGGSVRQPTDRKSSQPLPPAPTQEEAAASHPSWAAKKQQKTNIVAFQGKKITFD